MMYPLKFQKVLDLFDNPEVVQVKANNGNDMIPAGALWTQTSKNNNKYWSGKLNLVKLFPFLMELSPSNVLFFTIHQQ